ncbi:MAG: hypothetical protein AAF542_23100 [Pseudomonadota bacterium]|jgi:hypothetical protein
MKTLPILVAIILVPLSTLSMAKNEEAKQAAVDACLVEAEKRYGSAKAISKPKKYSGGKSSYQVKLEVGGKNKEVKCVTLRGGKIMITAK